MRGFRNVFNITFTDQKIEDNLTDSAAQCASSDDVETSALVVRITSTLLDFIITIKVLITAPLYLCKCHLVLDNINIFVLIIGVGTMGVPGAGAPLCFLIELYIARLNFIHTDHTALAYRSVEPPLPNHIALSAVR